MLDDCQEDVGARGEDPRGQARNWRVHDLRRTFRTIIGECGTPEEVAELLIGHVPPRLVRTYEPDGRLDQRAKAMSSLRRVPRNGFDAAPGERDEPRRAQIDEAQKVWLINALWTSCTCRMMFTK